MEEKKLVDVEDLIDTALIDEMLIELVKKKEVEIFENVVFQGKKRFYIEDLTEKDYSLENTTPYQLEIDGKIIQGRAWGNFLIDVVKVLLQTSNKTLEELLQFRSSWSKTAIFSIQKKTNFKPLNEELYLNCNHTALHSCWLLQELLDFFNIDKKSLNFLIYRPCSAEPKKIKEYVEKKFKNELYDFLALKKGKDEEYIQKIINNIDQTFNPILSSISKSYNNICLFDDMAILHNYFRKVREKITAKISDLNVVKKLNEYLDLLIEFYKE